MVLKKIWHIIAYLLQSLRYGLLCAFSYPAFVRLKKEHHTIFVVDYFDGIYADFYQNIVAELNRAGKEVYFCYSKKLPFSEQLRLEQARFIPQYFVQYLDNVILICASIPNVKFKGTKCKIVQIFHGFASMGSGFGEEFIKEYSTKFQCSVVRFAAVYSDWCEFAPLYKFLSTWLSRKIESRIIGGKGESAIPYIHIRDLCELIKTIILKTDELPDFDIYNASPNGSTSHKELFEISTRYYYGEVIKPINLPKFLAYPALIVRKLLQIFKLTCEDPFEQFWMVKYIDKKLDIDSSYTVSKLNWQTKPRYHINRRL
ncbi:MAG: hypothetical protein HUU02_01415, partial [Bacteroidetes bacterium]|nr:hypothetical protein [Bacteroidota bacterium]